MIRGLDRMPLPIPMPVFNPPDPPAPAPAPAPAPEPAPAPAPAPSPAPAPAPAPAPSPAPAPAPAPEPAPKDPPAPAADFPADWREKLAIGADGKVDPKELERLQRLSKPGDLWTNYKNAEARLSAKPGKDVPMPDAATDPDGNKRWREERGVPVESTGYTLPDDLTAKLLPEDKPILNGFTEFAFKKGAPAAFVQMGTEWYVDLMETQAAEQKTRDDAARVATEDRLRKVWGDDYRTNEEAAKMYATEAIPGVRWFDARLPNDPAKYGEYAGLSLGSVPGVSEALAKFARLEYGDTAFIGGEQTKATESRMAELKNIMNTDFPRWEKETALRTEYYGLLDAASKRPGAPKQ